DLATLSEKHFVNLIQAYNNTPRKCLDFQTPAEFFWDELLHFRCESSFMAFPSCSIFFRQLLDTSDASGRCAHLQATGQCNTL
ncbi:MAG TPA: hypothetical protein VN285_09035, partial [Candidatus Deferrimicrobium sp.]|nr:hypothetical protein [Candidatus Deferrimicrobium sp.]